MSLDIGPDLDRTRAPTPGAERPDPVEALAQQSGVTAEALRALSPEELSGMTHMEQLVERAAAAVETGQMTQVTYDATVAARDGVRALVAERTPGDAQASGTEQMAETRDATRALAPEDARVTIQGTEVLFGVKIHLYGSAATQATADAFERQIRHDWGQNPANGRPWTYEDPVSGKTYTVRFDVDVDLYRGPAGGPTQGERDLIFRGENYIEVVNPARGQQLAASGVHPHEHGFRSNIHGNRGQIRGYDYGSTPLIDISDAPHEFGHIIGFLDRYTDQITIENGHLAFLSEPNLGWEGNMMAEPAGQGYVDQDMIDRLVSPYMLIMNARGRDYYSTVMHNREPSDYSH